MPEITAKDFTELEVHTVDFLESVDPAKVAITSRLDVELVEKGLVTVGYSQDEAEELTAAGLRLLVEQQPDAPVEFDEEDLLCFALRKRPAPFGRPRRHGRNGPPKRS